MANMIGNGRINRAFSGIPTFLRANYAEDLQALQAKMAVFGVPFDEGAPYLPGMRFAPRSIREHSMRFSPSGFYDIDRGQHYLATEILDGSIVDVGDVDIAPTNIERTLDNITGLVRTLRSQNLITVGIGGDHSVSYPIIRGFDEPIHVIQFDAHLDFAPVTEQIQYSNGQPFRHVSTLEHVKSITQVGIRSLRVRPSEVADTSANGNHVYSMKAFRKSSLEQVFAHLPKGEKCYISIDIDAFDMSLTPGCVSAEPEGFFYQELMDALIALNEKMTIVGFDLVEVCPSLDVGTGVTSYLAAHTMVELMGHIFAKQNND
ncbi:arginase family protein [Celerinatantimonas sp. MCCC 1A17872]|uniref:arginase family protein n=1 Tax=Celerinatantimonas sp. MCCC 1A17872 TaxID=3177514 RepID=UPI0038C9C558